MWGNFNFEQFGNTGWPWLGLALLPGIWLLVVIDLLLRGYALWHAARRGQTVWFVVLLILNTAGILPLIYILINRNKKKK
jgi:hypothetical protein